VGPQLLILLLGLLGLSLGADSFTTGARELGLSIGISDRVLGATVVAFGTSLPELVTCVVGALRGHSEISLGNLLGSNLFNILFVGGSLGVISGGVAVAPGIIWFECMWVLAITAVLWPLTILPPQRMTIGRSAGALLAAAWVVFAIYSVIGGDAQ
jgi:cation:H+ antiporter